jgi:isoquinoline 1-oxidoreductase
MRPDGRRAGAELEPERYELRAVELRGAGTTTRRTFLKVMGGGLVVAFVTRDLFGAPRSMGLAQRSAAGGAAAPPEQIGAWIHIAEDGAVTVYTGKVEIGQGIRTSLAQEVAEELRVPVASVRMVMGDTDLTPFDMGTFGSRSTPQMGTQLRRAGAAARQLLVGIAAERWGVGRDGLDAEEGRVVDRKGGRSLGYGELTTGRPLTETVRDDVEMTPADRWRVAGTALRKTSGRDAVTGRLRYPSDQTLPGMRIGRVLRAPAMGARLERVDTAAAAKLPNVKVVRENDFVGVTAPSAPEAARALVAIDATWARTPQVSQQDLWDHLRGARPREAPRGGEFGGPGGSEEGDVAAGRKAADHLLTRTYTVAYIAHVPLEPRAAVARWDADGKLTVWTGTQRPFGVQEELRDAFGLPAEKVRVIVPDFGAAYGGKHTGECAVEAARLARAAGAPVKLVWTREEEFRWAYFRPAGVIDVAAGIRVDGTLTAWELDNYNSGSAGIRSLYTIPNQRIAFHASDSPFRQGSYRALAATANNFAREMHLDELASLAGIDPLELRLRNLKDARMKAALQAAAERFAWSHAAPSPGRGHGIAGCFEKGGYVATCADVSVDGEGGVRVNRVVTAFDCGAVVNPDNLTNQIVGATIQGLGGALFEEIDFDEGVVQTDRLSAYRVPRFRDVPAIEAVLIDRKDQPSVGAGETPITAVAPAIGAAIAAASGVRVRGLPMARRGVTAREARG